MAWTMDILSLDGTTTIVTGARFRSARHTWALDGPGAAEVELSAEQALSGEWLYGRRRVLFRNGLGEEKFQGWLDRLDRSGRPKQEQYRASARGLAAILQQRYVHGDFPQIEVVATTIAEALIAHAVAQPYDVTNFTVGAVTGVAPARSRWYCDGDCIQDMIDELANLTEGFAWEIDAVGAFNAWVGGRGTDLSATTTLAPSDAIDWNCTGDTTEFATYATGLGTASNAPCGPPLVVDFDAVLREDYGRREVVVDVGTGDEGELLEATEEELRARAAGRLQLKTAWIEGRGPWAFGDVWLGDVVKAQLGAEFGGDQNMRLTSIDMTMESGTWQFVECDWQAA